MPGELPEDFSLPYDEFEAPSRLFVVRSKSIEELRVFMNTGDDSDARKDELERLLEEENLTLATGVDDIGNDLDLHSAARDVYIDAAVGAYKLLSLQVEPGDLPIVEEQTFEHFFRNFIFGVRTTPDNYFTQRVAELEQSNRLLLAGVRDYMGYDRFTDLGLKICYTGAIATHDLLVQQQWKDDLGTNFVIPGGSYGLRN